MGRGAERGYLYAELLVGIGLFLVLLGASVLHISDATNKKWEVRAVIAMLERDLTGMQQQMIYGKPGKDEVNYQMYIFRSYYILTSGDKTIYRREFPDGVSNESGTYHIVFQRDGRPSQDGTIVVTSIDKKTVGIIYVASQTGRIRSEVRKRIT